MKNISQHNKWNTGVVYLHMEPPPIPLIKSNHNNKLDKDFVKIKFRRDTTSEKSDLYEFKMALSENGNSEEFLLFVHNFNMTLEASETLAPDANTLYIRAVFCGLVLH